MLSKKALIKVSFTHLLKQDLLLKELRITRLIRLIICFFRKHVLGNKIKYFRFVLKRLLIYILLLNSVKQN